MASGRLTSLVKRLLGGGVASPWPPLFERSANFLGGYTRPEAGVRVLCATGVGGHAVVRVIDSLVGTALWLRGADVRGLLCDEVLPACEAASYVNVGSPAGFAAAGPQRDLCAGCLRDGVTYFRGVPFAVDAYSQYVSEAQVERALAETARMSLDECYRHRRDGVALGEQARAGVLRFFGKVTFDHENPDVVLRIARRYLAGAIVTAEVARAVITAYRPDVVVAHHGVYVPQGVVGMVARSLGVRVVHWAASYRNTTVIYSHDETYHRTFMTEPEADWNVGPLSPAQDEALMAYLRERRGGRGDWTWITPERGSGTVEAESELRQALALDRTKPTFGLLTNVLWDAQLYYGGNAFTDMLDWLFATLDWFIAHPELQLVVRIHPHEVKDGNRQPTGPEIARRYRSLPSNIKIVERDSPFSTYALMDLCRAVLLYGTKTGVELAPFGMPVIVGGEAWIKNKGIALEAETREQYHEILERLPELQPLSAAQIDRAKRYAYHFFFRRMIPVASLDPTAALPPRYRIDTVADLLPGRDRGLDVICDGVLHGRPFCFDPEARR
jgi:hypothetical protein